VFTNLITNAAEAAGPRGRVQVLLQSELPTDPRPGAMVTISDSGAGVPESVQAKLFKPFFTTKGELGTGLGLWVSRGIVEKHGGKIELSNSTDPGYPGAAVRVYLPALGPAAATVRSGVPENGAARSPRSSVPVGRLEQV
jgi:signal transduction histidine kinase